MSINSEFSSESPYNFFFHPFKMLELEWDKKENLALAVFAIFAHAVLTLITAGLWQIPFWAVDYFKERKVEPIGIDNPLASKTDKAAKEIFPPGANSSKMESAAPIQTPSGEASVPDELLPVLERTPNFNNYLLTVPKADKGVILTGMKLRPSNLFLRALFDGKDVTTMPGGPLFRYLIGPHIFRNHIYVKPDDNVVSFDAKGVKSSYKQEGKEYDIPDLSLVYGDKTYSISFGEIKSDLESQQIYTSSLLPLVFYGGLKWAMAMDDIVTLPGSDSKPLKLSEIDTPHTKAFMQKAAKNPVAQGFKDEADFKMLSNMTIYQIGAMVVKVEDFHIFLDGKGHIRERKPGANDAIRLINSCGIRGIGAKNTPKEYNQLIMTETFRTALISAKDGYVAFPAVGMGVWRGPPEVYWPAFFDAVAACGTSFKSILINPNHQKTIEGKYAGSTGGEFKAILAEYLKKYEQDPAAHANLQKIVNLSSSGKDLVQLAYELKQEFPTENVSLFNASDPDVTLGYHVGEYVNNCPHTNTTEENYSAMGSNVLCFEAHTGVHKDPARQFQAYYSEDGKLAVKSLQAILQPA